MNPLPPLVGYILLPVFVVRLAFVHVFPDAAHLAKTYAFGDLNSYSKAVAAVACALWMLTIAAILRPRVPRVWTGLCVAAAAGVVFSAVLSPYPRTAWIGYTTLYEGAAVILSYLVAAWYCAVFAKRPEDRLFLLRIIAAVCIAQGAIGVAESRGWNVWYTDFGHWLAGAGGQNVYFQFADTHMTHGTLFQPNHYGMFMAMTGSLALGMTARDPGRLWRSLWAAAYAFALAGVFASNSRAGILTLLGVSALFIGFRATRRNVVIFGFAAVVVGAVSYVSPDGMVRRFAGRLHSLSANHVQAPAVQAVGLADNRLTLRIDGATIGLVKNSPNAWRLESGGSAQILAGTDRGDGWLRVDVPGVSNVRLEFKPQGNVRLILPDATLPLYAVGSRLWWHDEAGGRLADAVPLSGYAVCGREGFFNGRGYIWRRALEVWRENPWFGVGPGAFAQAFPNDELLNRQRFTDNENEDKGHGVWATFLVQTGIVGFALLCLPVLYAARRAAGAFRLPLLMGIVAYAVCGLTNDSTVGTTPVFVVLVGLAAASGTKDG